MQPVTVCAYEVDAEPVFDALDIEQCQALDVRESDLACPVWEAEMLAGAIPPSRSLADPLVTAGYMGMLVQSFAIADFRNSHNFRCTLHWSPSEFLMARKGTQRTAQPWPF